MDKTLEIKKDLELDYNQKLNYDIQIFDDINEMYEQLKEKNTDNKARMIAGYTFDSKSKNNH
ncbi:DNA/RNA helicase domain-containing protein [Spiroplasma sabaudiense]|uniref:DNA/RNA helicase domain-containing protein n=1 Tax=Spiroplasma sabaudiense TaxID=216944 RepID=UPI00046D8A95|nr:DNA/RNA helicase domain-containing protein [Spiroplasma sabaudiense]